MAAKIKLELDDKTGPDFQALVKRFKDTGIAAQDMAKAAGDVKKQLDAKSAQEYANSIKRIADEYDGTAAKMRLSSSSIKQQMAIVSPSDVKADQAAISHYKQLAIEAAEATKNMAMLGGSQDDLIKRGKKLQEALDLRAAAKATQTEREEIEKLAAAMEKSKGIKAGEADGEGGFGKLARMANSTGMTRGHEMQLLRLGEMGDKAIGTGSKFLGGETGAATIAKLLGTIATGAGIAATAFVMLDSAGSRATSQLKKELVGLWTEGKNAFDGYMETAARGWDSFVSFFGGKTKTLTQELEKEYQDAGNALKELIGLESQWGSKVVAHEAMRQKRSGTELMTNADRDRAQAERLRGIESIGSKDDVMSQIGRSRSNYDRISSELAKRTAEVNEINRRADIERKGYGDQLGEKQEKLKDLLKLEKSQDRGLRQSQRDVKESLERQIADLLEKQQKSLDMQVDRQEELTKLQKDSADALATTNAWELRNLAIMDKEADRARELKNSGSSELKRNLGERFDREKQIDEAVSAMPGSDRDRANYRKDLEERYRLEEDAKKRAEELADYQKQTGIDAVQFEQANQRQKIENFKQQKDALYQQLDIARAIGQQTDKFDVDHAAKLHRLEEDARDKEKQRIDEARKLRDQMFDEEKKHLRSLEEERDLEARRAKARIDDEAQDKRRARQEEIDAENTKRQHDEAIAQAKHAKEKAIQDDAKQQFLAKQFGEVTGQQAIDQFLGGIDQQKVIKQLAQQRSGEKSGAKFQAEYKKANLQYQQQFGQGGDNQLYDDDGNPIKLGLKKKLKTVDGKLVDDKISPEELQNAKGGAIDATLKAMQKSGQISQQGADALGQMAKVSVNLQNQQSQVQQQLEQISKVVQQVLSAQQGGSARGQK